MRIGEYELERELARGGQGAVYLGRRADGRPVAIKVLLAGLAAGPTLLRRFAREVQAQARLRHPHVVAILDSGTHQGLPYLVMEYVAGTSLAQRLRAGPLAPRDAAELIRKLALALEHAHQQNVLHRDLKPGNVLIDEQGEPRLTDFGLTRDLDPSGSLTRLSVSGQLLGTPGYLAPEQAFGRAEEIGPATDVFGLGAVLYACLCARAPYDGHTINELLARLTAPPEPPGRLRPGLDRELERICMRCLATRPEERWASAAALAGALEGWLARPARAPRAHARWLLPAVPGLLLAAALAAWWLRPDPLGEAWRLLRRPGDPAKLARAVQLLEEPLRGEPPPARALALRALARLQGDEDTAQACVLGEVDVTRALALEPADPVVLYVQSRWLFAEGRRAEALVALERAIALDPREARFYVQRAHLSLYDSREEPGWREQATRAAIADYGRALELDPSLDDVVERHASLLAYEGDLPAAVQGFSRLIELRPTDAEAWEQRGAVRLAAGDLPGALADLNRSLEMDPRQTMAHLRRSEARERAGDLAGALADLEACQELEPDFGLEEAIARLRARMAEAR